MNERRTLSCAAYDHIEVACLGRYRLLIEFWDGRSLEAEARNTQTSCGEEFLVIRMDDGEERMLAMSDLLAITPLSPEARFSRTLLAQTSC